MRAHMSCTQVHGGSRVATMRRCDFLSLSLSVILSLLLSLSLIAFASLATGLPLVKTEGDFCQAPLLPCLRAMRWGDQRGHSERPANKSIEVLGDSVVPCGGTGPKSRQGAGNRPHHLPWSSAVRGVIGLCANCHNIPKGVTLRGALAGRCSVHMGSVPGAIRESASRGGHGGAPALLGAEACCWESYSRTCWAT